MHTQTGPLPAGKEKEWDDFVLRSGTGTFFHLTGWKKIVVQTFGFEPVYLYSSDGDQILGILPLFRAPILPFANCLVSTPFAVYGGICTEYPETENALMDAATGILAESNGKYIELRNLKASNLALPVKDLYATFRRPIFDTEEANMAAIPRKERAEIRKGIKNNLDRSVGCRRILDIGSDLRSRCLESRVTAKSPR